MLSNAINFTSSDLKQNMKITFDNFNERFINKDKRPKLYGYFIYFETNRMFYGKELPYPEKLLHIISNDISSDLDILPCINDPASVICKTKCKIRFANFTFNLLGRQECYFRMARIHWIPEIINLANLNSENVKVWEEKKGNAKNKKKVTKTFIRYQNDIVDYIIILKNRNKEGKLVNYVFETAFPVFFTRTKEQYNISYNNSMETIKK